ncbi:hybrid signal transduction histidine kinase M-like [Colias croceus]|uniref:hybrid signal transduction histidine kinase M-like n=1 Tax=Colias crocea TaxID=72248 RepID=UPI001E27A654|nr:hybrid signal transduction histidine kinase M-like [Colias croceus]
MIAQLIAVAVVSSVVHTRHVNEDFSAYKDAVEQFAGNHYGQSDLNAFGQPEGYQQIRHTDHSLVVPKTNLHRPNNVKQVNGDSAYIINERSQQLRLNPESNHRFESRNSEPIESGVVVTQNTREHLGNSEPVRVKTAVLGNGVQNNHNLNENTHNHATQLNNAQGQRTTTPNQNNKNRTASRSKQQNHVKALNNQHNVENNVDHVHHVEPVTEKKLYTNSPTSPTPTQDNKEEDNMWIWSDKGETTPGTDLEDRAAFSGDGCPTGKTKINGSDMCIEKH